MLDIDKMDKCRHLLPEPGDKIAGELITEIRMLRELVENPQTGRGVNVRLNFLLSAIEQLVLAVNDQPEDRPVTMPVKVWKKYNAMLEVAQIDSDMGT